jgi:hypothetical protein
MATSQILLPRDAIAALQIRDETLRALAPGGARLTLDLFSLIANNVTDAALETGF